MVTYEGHHFSVGCGILIHTLFFYIIFFHIIFATKGWCVFYVFYVMGILSFYYKKNINNGKVFNN